MSMTREKEDILKRAARGGVLDRFISWRDPIKGAERMRARMFMAMTGTWIGGDTTRRQTKLWSTRTGDADTDNLTDLPKIRERSRDLLRNAPIALGAVNTVTTNVVGSGLRCKPSIDHEVLGMAEAEADEWEKNARREWLLWSESKDCDSTRTQNFYGLQELAFRGVLESGDIFASQPFIERDHTPYRLAVQMIEADRVSNPENKQDTQKLTAGVEKDDNGAPTAYHVSNFHPGSVRFPFKARKWDRLEAFGAQTGRQNVIHLFTRTRPGQTRGMPYLAPVMEPLKILDKYTEAELMAAVISGMFAVFIKTANAQGLDNTTDLGAETGAKVSDKDFTEAVGSIVDLTPDEDVTSVSPGRPNQSFDPFVQAIIRQIGVALEIPFEMMVKHYTASYSAARAAILDAWKFFRKRRSWLAQNFCQPVYENFMDEAVAIGRISAPGYFNDPIIRKAYLGARWDGPGRGMINEKQEGDAIQTRLEIGLSTLEQESAEYNGTDWQGNHRESVREQAARVEGGLAEPVGVAVAAPMPVPPPVEEDEEQWREALRNLWA